MTATATAARPASLVGAGRSAHSYNRLSRLSAKAASGAALTVGWERQESDAEDMAERKHLGPVTHMTDKGYSASRFAQKERPEWLALLDAIRGHRVSVVLIWVLDRVIRQTRELDELLDACRETGTVLMQTYGAGMVIDPDDPDSVMAAKMQGVIAEAEAAKMSRRQKRSHMARAEMGAWHGGRRRFGYNADMSALDPAEVAALKDAARRVLNGESLGSITKDWNARGILTPTGKAWRSPNVGKLLRGKHLAGIRVHHGNEYPALWPAVFDAATHEALARLLGDPERRVSGFDGTRVFPLSGVLRCATCGGPCYGRNTKLKSGPAYACRENYCTQAPAAAVESTVRALLIDRLSQVNAAGLFVAPVDREAADARQAERLALQGRLDAIPDDYAAGNLDGEQAKAATAKIKARLAKLAEEQAADDADAAVPARVLAGLTGLPADITARRFDALSPDHQRSVIGVLGVPSLARAARKGVGLPWDRDRVVFQWAGDA